MKKVFKEFPLEKRQEFERDIKATIAKYGEDNLLSGCTNPEQKMNCAECESVFHCWKTIACNEGS